MEMGEAAVRSFLVKTGGIRQLTLQFTYFTCNTDHMEDNVPNVTREPIRVPAGEFQTPHRPISGYGVDTAGRRHP